MIPLLLLLVYGASLLIPREAVEHFLLGLFKSYVPTMPHEQKFLTENVSRLGSAGTHIGIVGILGLIWTTTGGFVSLQQTLDVIWESRHRRSFIVQYVIGFSMMGILLLVTVLSSLASAVTPALTYSMRDRVDAWPWLFLAQEVSRVLFPLLLFVTCYFCYRFLPSLSSPKRYLLISSLLSTCAIYLSRWLFVWYVGHLSQYESIYGTLTFIMLFLFWIYIVSMIVLFGAELAASLRKVWGSGSSAAGSEKS